MEKLYNLVIIQFKKNLQKLYFVRKTFSCEHFNPTYPARQNYHYLLIIITTFDLLIY